MLSVWSLRRKLRIHGAPFICGSATLALNGMNKAVQVGSMKDVRRQGESRPAANVTDGGARRGTIRALPVCAGLLGLAVAACTPTVKVQAPDKPIEINLNVKIEQEIRIKVDRELDDLFANNPDLF